MVFVFNYNKSWHQLFFFFFFSGHQRTTYSKENATNSHYHLKAISMTTKFLTKFLAKENNSFKKFSFLTKLVIVI